ncbi:MAG: carboxymuconolactone decarboxylase family protein [Ginsengibacter sp.]
MMKRININEIQPGAYKAMLGMEKYIRESGLSITLCELIKVRASQINGCAYCLDMHTREALKNGESNNRLFAVAAWKESPLFTEKEKAALQMTDEITLISKEGVSDETYNKVLELHGEESLAQIIMQIVIINSWNRVAVSTHMVF